MDNYASVCSFMGKMRHEIKVDCLVAVSTLSICFNDGVHGVYFSNRLCHEVKQLHLDIIAILCIL